MDRKKANDKRGDNQKRMMRLSSQLPVCPHDQFFHQPWCVGREGSLKNDADTPPMLVEGFDIIRDCLVSAAVMLIPRGELQKRAMKLLDVVLRQRYLRPGVTHQLSCLCVSRHFLFVSRAERTKVKIRQKNIHFTIG